MELNEWVNREGRNFLAAGETCTIVFRPSGVGD